MNCACLTSKPVKCAWFKSWNLVGVDVLDTWVLSGSCIARAQARHAHGCTYQVEIFKLAADKINATSMDEVRVGLFTVVCGRIKQKLVGRARKVVRALLAKVVALLIREAEIMNDQYVQVRRGSRAPVELTVSSYRDDNRRV